MTQAGRVCACSGKLHPPRVFQPLLGPSLKPAPWKKAQHGGASWTLEGRMWG